MNITLHNEQMIQLCEKCNLIGLIRSPLASGILTGKYKEQIKITDDHMLANIDFSQERYKIINQKLPKIEEILEEEGRTLVQGLLGYLMATSKTTIPIPGAKTVEQIEENAKTLDFGPLSHDNVKQIDDLLSDLDDK